ncbi:alpha/beta fold hydrolase [Isobaculum melis]|uniref:Pimeloyl-ACP methyl ester carboxylesterase n=1 Tax=Isobaculum melis TaxID=142588 RepID=A0A1H9TLR5_9LACT|nr:alpha/beta fold hydrolase [Isobaculum melis]SER97563.1 Pimeloyl-ACP methyl ester carboxylesterase [Isobaculum melis]
MKVILLILLGLFVLFVLMIVIGRLMNTQKFKIRSETGIQKSEYVVIGGIKQYIQIRGKDISNPVIIMLHGGPGNNLSSYSYKWQKDIEQDYTIVQWDQRGSGNTYYCNKKAEKPNLKLLLSDLDELVDYIKGGYDKEKVIILGHSWGTFLGGVYSQKHPEKIAIYISIGQMLDFKKTEQISTEEAIRLANASNNKQDVKKMRESLASVMMYQKFDKSEATKLMKFRQLKERYLPTQHGNEIIPLYLFSPYMTFNHLKWMLKFDNLIESNSTIYKELLSGELTMYSYSMQYEVPIMMISGDRDWTTPRNMALDYFNHIAAPSKEFITIKNAGHIPFVDKPRDFSSLLLLKLNSVMKNGQH